MLWTESWRWRANSCNIFGFRLQRLYPAFLLINGLQKQILIFFSSFWVTVKERLQKAESLRSVAPFKINKFRKLSLSEEEKKSPLNQLGLFFIFFPASCSCEKIEERGRLIQTLANINNKLPPFLPLWRKKWDNPCVNHSGQSAFRLTVNWQTQDKSCTIFFMDFCCFVCFFASRVMNYVRVKKSQIQINISSWQDPLPRPPPLFFLLSYDERVLRNGSSTEEVSALFRQTDSFAASAADVICGTTKKKWTVSEKRFEWSSGLSDVYSQTLRLIQITPEIRHQLCHCHHLFTSTAPHLLRVFICLEASCRFQLWVVRYFTRFL